MNAVRLFKSLLDLARHPVPAPGVASQPKQLWLEQACPCGAAGCGVCAAAVRERDWLGADLYRRQHGGPR